MKASGKVACRMDSAELFTMMGLFTKDALIEAWPNASKRCS